jgi:hypothetical protein
MKETRFLKYKGQVKIWYDQDDRISSVSSVKISKDPSLAENHTIMTQIVSLQQAIESVESLSLEEQDLLIELIQKRRIEQRRQQIATHATQTLESLEAGTAKRGTLADLRADLLGEE